MGQGLNSQADNVDFDAIWATLSNAFREIHTKNASSLSYEENYRLAYRLVLKKKGDLLYDHVKDFEEAWLSNEVRSRIRDQLSDRMLTGGGGGGSGTINEKRLAGERFLRGVKDAWEDHNLCISMTTDVLMYMVHNIQYALYKLSMIDHSCSPGSCILR